MDGNGNMCSSSSSARMCAICQAQTALPESETPMPMCASCLSNAFQAQTLLLHRQQAAKAASLVVNNNHFTVNVSGGSAATVNNSVSTSAQSRENGAAISRQLAESLKQLEKGSPPLDVCLGLGDDDPTILSVN
jgi:hypothetical protein